ncbi:MAG TPA: GNAT family N-acetyltransferase [Steroidobacteraceae bacterium]|jgi:GNAT superfamily N-acetyltransferase
MANEAVREGISIRAALATEIGTVLQFIRELAEYEHLEHQCVATEEGLRATLFGPRPYAEVVFACVGGEPVGFALFFHNFSTFLGKPGIYLEDLYVRPAMRGGGVGRRLLEWLAALAVERGCGRLEWAVLDWNAPSIGFYRSLGATPLDEWTVFRLTGDALTSLASRAAGAGLPESKR